MSRRPPDDFSQYRFSFAAATVQANGRGGFVVTPGKPMVWVSTEVAATSIGVSPATLRSYLQTGFLPVVIKNGDGGESQVARKCGPRLWEFNLPVLEELQKKWTEKALS